jgi:ribosomal protein S18 acetylase RimI-like enzyme
LLSTARKFAKDTGAVSMSLETAKDNFTAQSLYKKAGYKEEDFLLFELDLKESASTM